MKKLIAFLLIFTALIVSGCFGGDDKTEETAENDKEPPNVPIVESKNRYDTADFSIGIPENWEVMKSFPQDYPEGLQVAIRNNVKAGQEFIANITVTRHDLNIPMTSLEYAHQQIFDHQNTLLNFQELAKEVISLSINDQTEEALLSVFEGKQKPEESTIKFYQTYGVKDQVAFIATCAIERAEEKEVVAKCEHSVRSLVVK